jgi:hypothetical protein
LITTGIAALVCVALLASNAIVAVPASAQPDESRINVSGTRSSEHGIFEVTIRNTELRNEVGRMQTWMVYVRDAAGRPVTDATIAFSGGMPGHDHGFPTEPRVTRHVNNGAYALEGVRFHMSGWWQFVFEIEAHGEQDRVSFDLIIEP